MKTILLTILLFTVQILSLFNDPFNPNDYKNHEIFDDGNYQIYWNVEKDEIQIALQANTTGWLGFGLGEPTSGSMPGSDIVTASWNSNTLVVHDRYAEAFAEPVVDKCENWKLVNFWKSDGSLIVALIRKLNTDDSQDRPFVAGPMRIVWAYGDSPDISYHGSNRGASVVTFIPVNATRFSEKKTSTYHIQMPDVPLPAEVTTYYCKSFAVPNTSTDYHVIKIEPTLNPSSAKYVHHFIVHICGINDSPNNLVRKYKNAAICPSPLGNVADGCYGIAFAWAVGGGPLEFPLEAGLRVGSSADAVQYVILEIHYNNPNTDSGVVDNSGVTFTYTPELRKYDAATMILGDILVSEYPIPGQKQDYMIESSCPSECTNNWSSDINVFADFLHMHSHGRSMWSTQWRSGARIPGYLNRIEYWEFDFQQITNVNRVIKRGDRINTICSYDTMDTPATSSVRFGTASQDEMCLEIISYYPKLVDPTGLYGFCGKLRGSAKIINGQVVWDDPPKGFLTVCGSLYSGIIFENNATVMNPTVKDPPGEDVRTFGIPPSTCT